MVMTNGVCVFACFLPTRPHMASHVSLPRMALMAPAFLATVALLLAAPGGAGRALSPGPLHGAAAADACGAEPGRPVAAAARGHPDRPVLAEAPGRTCADRSHGAAELVGGVAGRGHFMMQPLEVEQAPTPLARGFWTPSASRFGSSAATRPLTWSSRPL
ncbi:unnamed protein product [Prorocentrum cordatum]|uniref:Phospholipase B-like n=1 Tax=Prorocentrum cordatum TaxID=2364126 RepID=A0ABN9WIA5_9DINO|nr:unnamed protein product [Polarella glacialis]